MSNKNKLRIFSALLITLMLVSLIPDDLFYTNNFNQLNHNKTSPNNIKQINVKEIIENKIQADVNISENNIKNQFSENEIIIELSNIPIDLKEDKLISDSEWDLSFIPGAPSLPVRHYNILLPPNIDIQSVKIEVIADKPTKLEGEYEYLPAPFPASVRKEGNILSYANDMSCVYNINAMWPSQIVEFSGIEQMRDAIIAEFIYYPFQYNPITKERIEHNDVKVSITWVNSDIKKVDILTKHFLTKMEKDIYNLADMIPLYETNEVPDSSYIIITTNDIKSNSDKLDDFVRYKEASGFNVDIITEDDYGIATGEQRVLNIRAWLQSHYISDSIEYVLLIGNPDPDDIGPDSVGDLPMLMCWPRSGEAKYNQSPTDYIYADLTGNWDTDGDGYYGEYPDDTGVDFAPEVYVGRIPVYSSDYATLDNILQNIIDHHLNAGAEKNKMLLPMAISNYFNEDYSGNPRTDGLNCPEEVYNNILKSIGMEDTVMYERSGINPVPTTAFHYDMALDKSNFISEFNNGHGVVFWWGHGSKEGVYRKYWLADDGDNVPEDFEMYWSAFLTSNDMNLLETDQPAFFYQSSCNNGEPENSNNLGYSLLKRGAAISTVSASRESWYAVETWYSYYFNSVTDNTGLGYAYMDNLLRDEMTAGEALYLAKEAGGEVWEGASWMNKMDFNLYGDPQINYWGSNQPNVPSNPNPSDRATGVNINPTLSVVVSDPDGDLMNVAFYDTSDNSLIDIDLQVPNGGTASIIWSGLSEGTTYQWYVIISDGQCIRQSSIWEFTTVESSGNIIFIDTFNESILNPAWTWSPSESSYSLTTYPNRFSMEVAADEDTWIGEFDSPQLYQNAPSGNWTMETFIQTNAGLHSQTGLLFFEDTSKWLVWGYIYDNEPDNHGVPGVGLEGRENNIAREELYFDSISSSEWNAGIYLRIEFFDFNNTFRYSYKKTSEFYYTTMGWRVIDWSNLKIGFWGKSWGTNPGYDSNFDYFLISKYPVDNNRPNAPINPTPSDKATGVSINPTLSIDLSDPDGDIMDVLFYDASDNSLIGIDRGIHNGGTASLSWSGLSPLITYHWYSIVDDGIATYQSSTWLFTVGEIGILFEDDFELYPVDSFPYNYELIYNGAGNSYQKITDDYSVSGTQSFTLTGASSWSAVASREISYSSNYLILEAQIMSETPSGSTGGNDNNIEVGFWNPNAATWGEYYVLINFRNDGKITLEGGTTELILGNYSAFTWYKVKLIMNLDENSVQAYVNENLLGETSLTKDSTKTTDVAICSGWKGITGYIDDLKVYECNIVNLPDLKDRGSSYSGWLRFNYGDLNVWCNVENIGTESAGTFNVSYYASLDKIISSSDYFIGFDTISSIEAGEWADSSWSGPVPIYIPDGEYYVGWIIDSNNDIDECNENNNKYCIIDYLLHVDYNAPSSMLFYIADYTPNYVLDMTSFSISADDGAGSGIDIIWYRIDGRSWIEYSGAFTLSGYGEGLHTIEYYSVDNVGHVESTNSEDVYLDITAVSSMLSFIVDYAPNYVLDTTSFSISADDGAGSGVDIIWYRIDSGSWIEYSGAFTLSGYGEGLHTIEYYS
ncbi:MAG: C25 family cysteine peptidase, partial [Promethearchaeota archaeon]